MGTKVYTAYHPLSVVGTSTKNSLREWLDYTLSANNDTTYSLNLFSGIQIDKNYSGASSSGNVSQTITGTGQTNKTGSKAIDYRYAQVTTIINQWTWSWTKTHNQQTVAIKINPSSGFGDLGSLLGGGASGDLVFTIPAKTSYIVSYDANGGTGAPGNQTKWYGENLTLSTVKPTRDQYTFVKWNTKADGTGTDYNPGATYTGNNALTLYAIWEKTYYLPQISNLKFIRCESDGEPNDEGDYALVTFDWSVDRWKYPSNAVSGNAISVTLSDNTISIPVTGAAANNKLSGSIVAANKKILGSAGHLYSEDTSYEGTVTLTDTATGETVHSVTASAILPASEFPIDISLVRKSIGIFMSASDEEDNVVNVKGKVVENNGTRDIDLQISDATIAKYVALGMSTT